MFGVVHANADDISFIWYRRKQLQNLQHVCSTAPTTCTLQLCQLLDIAYLMHRNRLACFPIL